MKETWIDIMPAIPLEAGCPVVLYPAAHRWRVVVIAPDSFGGWIGYTANGLQNTFDARQARPDLDTATGFGVALRWGVSQGVGGLMDTILRHIEGRTTHADRIALARACAELAR